ncbi:hypothetical protein RCL1_008102 [Eukaryota sp. TZLM3-RCL]
MSINLHSTCLFHVFYQLLNCYNADKFFQLAPVVSIFAHLSKFANVSSFFRSTILRSVSSFLITTNPSFTYPKHKSQLKFLQQFFHACSFSIISLINSTSIPDFNSISMNSLSLHDLDDTLKDTLVHQILLCNKIYKLENLSVTCICSQWLLDELSLMLPCLKSLTLNDTILSTEILIFPSNFESLTVLTIELSSTRKLSNIDVSRLFNLQKLSFWGHSQSFLSGLSSLSRLSFLSLRNVSRCDALHPQATLSFLSVDNIPSTALDLIFSQKYNFIKCKMKFERCIVSSQLDWTLQFCSHVSLYSNSTIQSLSGATHPNTESLNFYAANSVLLNLQSCKRLSSLLLDHCKILNGQLCISQLLLLLKLEVRKVEASILFLILNHSPYLHQLSVHKLYNDVPGTITSLNYLRRLSVVNSSYFFASLPCLPRLYQLEVFRIVQFDISLVHQMFPSLFALNISSCPLLVTTNHKVSSVRRLRLYANSPENCREHVLAVSVFTNIEHLIVNFPFSFLSLEQLIPLPSVKFCWLRVPFAIVKKWLEQLDVEVVVHADLYVTNADKVEAKLLCSRLIQCQRVSKLVLVFDES